MLEQHVPIVRGGRQSPDAGGGIRRESFPADQGQQKIAGMNDCELLALLDSQELADRQSALDFDLEPFKRRGIKAIAHDADVLERGHRLGHVGMDGENRGDDDHGVVRQVLVVLDSGETQPSRAIPQFGTKRRYSSFGGFMVGATLTQPAEYGHCVHAQLSRR